MIKKINAILGFLSAVLTLVHIFTMGGLIAEISVYMPIFSTIGKVLLAVFTVHILISLIVMFFYPNKENEQHKLKKSTIEQRIASILLMVAIHFHMTNYFSNNTVVKPSVFGFVTEVVLIVLFMCHFMPSVDRGLNTFSINKKAVQIIIKIIFLIAFLFALYAVGCYFLSALL